SEVRGPDDVAYRSLVNDADDARVQFGHDLDAQRGALQDLDRVRPDGSGELELVPLQVDPLVNARDAEAPQLRKELAAATLQPFGTRRAIAAAARNIGPVAQQLVVIERQPRLAHPRPGRVVPGRGVCLPEQ